MLAFIIIIIITIDHCELSMVSIRSAMQYWTFKLIQLIRIKRQKCHCGVAAKLSKGGGWILLEKLKKSHRCANCVNSVFFLLSTTIRIYKSTNNGLNRIGPHHPTVSDSKQKHCEPQSAAWWTRLRFHRCSHYWNRIMVPMIAYWPNHYNWTLKMYVLRLETTSETDKQHCFMFVYFCRI